MTNFHETNVRTYVHLDGRDPGVWFFSLDAANPVVVTAATLVVMPVAAMPAVGRGRPLEQLGGLRQSATTTESNLLISIHFFASSDGLSQSPICAFVSLWLSLHP